MHHRTHTKEKPLKCEICDAVFTESSNLSKHRRTHMLKGLFECELCGKDFNRLDQLRRHLNSCHSEKPEVINSALERARQWRKRHHQQQTLRRNKSTSNSTLTTPTPTATSDAAVSEEADSAMGGTSFVKRE